MAGFTSGRGVGATVAAAAGAAAALVELAAAAAAAVDDPWGDRDPTASTVCGESEATSKCGVLGSGSGPREGDCGIAAIGSTMTTGRSDDGGGCCWPVPAAADGADEDAAAAAADDEDAELKLMGIGGWTLADSVAAREASGISSQSLDSSGLP